jgi:hypothetical protein
MNDLRTAAQQALDYMKSVGQMDMHPEEWAIVGRLEAALAESQHKPIPLNEGRLWQYPYGSIGVGTPAEPVQEPVQEPVAYAVGRTLHWHEGKGVNDAQLYLAAPPQRKPLTLTDEVIAELWHKNGGFHHHFAKHIERWLKGGA